MTVTVGVVGLGYWGPNLARNFARIEGCNLQYLCDLSQDLLDKHASTAPAAICTTRYEDLLEDPEVDAIVLASPVPTPPI